MCLFHCTGQIVVVIDKLLLCFWPAFLKVFHQTVKIKCVVMSVNSDVGFLHVLLVER